MKKLLMILLGAMLVLSMAGSAVAAADDPHTVSTTDSPVDTRVTLGLSELFEVTLPSLIELDYDEVHDSFVGKAPFSIDIMRLASNNELKISVTSQYIEDGAFYLVSAGQPNLHYKIGWGFSGQHVPDEGQEGNPSYASVIRPGDTFISTDEDKGLREGEELYIHAKVDIDDTTSISVSDTTYSGTLTFTVTTGQPQNQ